MERSTGRATMFARSHCNDNDCACGAPQHMNYHEQNIWAEYGTAGDADEDIGLQEPNWLEVDSTAPCPTPAGSASEISAS